MWSCPRCGTRNARGAEHCQRCGMPSPLGDGGTTQTMDIPTAEADARANPPRARASLPWVAIVVAVAVLLGLLLLAVSLMVG